MSVYSGFATRNQQTKYNTLVQTLVITLKKRIIKFYAGEQCDEDKFKLLIKKLYKKMFLLEKGKFMAPKYTSCFTDLIDNLNIQINYDSLSECSSMMSQTFSLRKNSADQNNRDHLRSKNLLASKKNLLQVKASKIFNASSFSLSKNVDFLSPTMQNGQEDEFNRLTMPKSTSLDPYDTLVRRQKSKVKFMQLKNLKDLRGTINMPKVEDFLPKKEALQPVSHPRKNTFLQQKGAQSPKQPQQQQSKVVFRRNKYSRPDIKMQDI